MAQLQKCTEWTEEDGVGIFQCQADQSYRNIRKLRPGHNLPVSRKAAVENTEPEAFGTLFPEGPLSLSKNLGLNGLELDNRVVLPHMGITLSQKRITLSCREASLLSQLLRKGQAPSARLALPVVGRLFGFAWRQNLFFFWEKAHGFSAGYECFPAKGGVTWPGRTGRQP